MANVINKITKQIRLSVNTPNYNPDDWVIDPGNLENALLLEACYRVIEGDSIREATVEEKTVIDDNRMPELRSYYMRQKIEEVLLNLDTHVNDSKSKLNVSTELSSLETYTSSVKVCTTSSELEEA